MKHIATLTLALLFFHFAPTAYAQHDHDHEAHQQRLTENLAAPEGANIGDTKFMHAEFHDAYGELTQHINADAELGPGDTGFYPELDGAYRSLYSGTKCNCDYGSCRPTNIRIARPPVADGDSGYEALVDGQWYPVPSGSLYQENDLPADLRYKLLGNLPPKVNGHACAFPVDGYPNGMNVECAIVDDSLG